MEVLNEQFVIFEKNYLLGFHRIFLLYDKSNPLIIQICFMRRTIAYLCPNMIHFDEVDFSERHSEEGMFLLTLSVVPKTSLFQQSIVPECPILGSFRLT